MLLWDAEPLLCHKKVFVQLGRESTISQNNYLLLILLVGVVSEFVIEFLHIGNGFLLPLT